MIIGNENPYENAFEYLTSGGDSLGIAPLEI